MSDMTVGSWNRLPHYTIVGRRTDFYIWVNEGGRGRHSEWIKGRYAFALYNELNCLFKKDKAQFVQRLKQEHLKFIPK